MELFKALGALIERPAPDHQKLADLLGLGPIASAADHSDLFVFQLYPYASVYLSEEGMLGGEAGDRIAGFWRALALTPPPEPDHLSLMLAFYAELSAREKEAETDRAREGCRRARKAFLWEHLLAWLPVYLDKLHEVAAPFYRDWGQLLFSTLVEEARQLGSPDRLPLHLREAPQVTDPRTGGGDAFLDSLLTPLRSGIILVRSDLKGAAHEIDLGSRIGERRTILKALFGQDATEMLRWLGRKAAAGADRYCRFKIPLEPIAHFWRRQARKTALLLEDLAAES